MKAKRKAGRVKATTRDRTWHSEADSYRARIAELEADQKELRTIIDRTADRLCAALAEVKRLAKT